jgi:hypothetical protein
MAAHRFEQVGAAHHVGGEGVGGVGVAVAHDRLGGEVEDDVGIGFLDGCFQLFEVAHVALVRRADAAADPGGMVEARLGVRRAGVAVDPGAHQA